MPAISVRDGTVEVQVPAAVLESGDHELRLSLATEPGRFVEFGSYSFTVVR